MNNVIITDIDHTIADSSHRNHLLGKSVYTPDKNTDFNKWMENAEHDQYIFKTISILHAIIKYNPYTKLYIWTGRGEEFKSVTEQWLSYTDLPYSKMFMRDKRDKFTPNATIKKRFLDIIQKDSKVMMVFDDDPDVNEMLAKNNILCYRPNGVFV